MQDDSDIHAENAVSLHRINLVLKDEHKWTEGKLHFICHRS